jgi:hypothetical protein
MEVNVLKQICSGYCHVMPGRLRVRVTGLRKKADAARSLEVLLRSQPGIQHVHANPITCNVLVKFDSGTTSCDAILRSLEDLGHLPVASASDSAEEAAATDGALGGIGMSLGKEIAKIALKQALRGSPVALILELL